MTSLEQAQRDRIDAAMLRSMSASFRARLGFSFNPDDMADLMGRMADRVDPRPVLVALKTQDQNKAVEND